MKKSYFEIYAKLLATKGIALQKDETVVITGPIEASHFVKIVVKTCYDLGAKRVIVDWVDDDLNRLRFENQDIDTLKDVPEYIKEKYNYYKEMNASFIYLKGDNPDGLNGIETDKIISYNVAMQNASKVVGDLRMADVLKWTIGGIPTQKWADKVFDNDEKSLEKLWVSVLQTVRVDLENPEKRWEEHSQNLKKYSKYLNDMKFDSLYFSNGLGTNLVVGLPKDYIFAGGGATSTNGEDFIANMPTEEVFSMPHKNNVSGIVYATKPLNYSGSLIKDFWIRFENGKAVEFGAKEGESMLKELLKVDEGASRLGEVAIVNHDSPISNSNILYYNTLFDENASCHLALGRAYPTCLKGSEKMTKKQLEEAGVNDSLIHVDFMFGSEDMIITGVKGNKKTVFFENGNFKEDLV